MVGLLLVLSLQIAIHIHLARISTTTTEVDNSVAVDNFANVIVGGTFYGAVDLGNGPAKSAGLSDVFVAKFIP